MKKIQVQDKSITITTQHDVDYIFLTDMVRGEEGDDYLRNWMRTRDTVEFLGIWEEINNPQFKGVEFDTFKKQAGLNSFNLTPKKWIEATNAIGIISKAGRYGGTYAHKDIAFEFGMWISPTFRLYLIKEYDRLKAIETNHYNLEWDAKRILSKANYYIQTDAVQKHLIPKSTLPLSKQGILYAEEADLLNLAIFGCRAVDWQEANPERAKAGENLRDMASINELTVLSNIESMNAEMIKLGIEKEQRFFKLQEIAGYQLSILNQRDEKRTLKKTDNTTFLT